MSTVLVIPPNALKIVFSFVTFEKGKAANPAVPMQVATSPTEALASTSDVSDELVLSINKDISF